MQEKGTDIAWLTGTPYDSHWTLKRLVRKTHGTAQFQGADCPALAHHGFQLGRHSDVQPSVLIQHTYMELVTDTTAAASTADA